MIVRTVWDSTVSENRIEFTYGHGRDIFGTKRLGKKVYWANLKVTGYREMSSLHASNIYP